jgi:hypothetical protein
VPKGIDLGLGTVTGILRLPARRRFLVRFHMDAESLEKS